MAFDFPNAPTNGQVFVSPGGPKYTWNGYAWAKVGGGAATIISDTPPPDPSAGQLWVESDSGAMFSWWDDGSGTPSAQWVQIGGSGIPDAPNDGYPYQRVNGVWQRQKGVIQQKLFYDSVDFTRASASEAVMSTMQSFYPLYPDSKVYWEWWSYATVTTTAATDDLRARLYGKFYDSVSAYVGTLSLVLLGHYNSTASPSTSSVFYCAPCGAALDVSTYRRTDTSAPGAITIRMYGQPDYASNTLDTYDCTMRFTEVLE